MTGGEAAELRARLSATAAPLLDAAASAGAQRRASIALFDLCASLVGPHALPEGGTPLALAHGIALDPLQAARCVLDFARTARFLQGVEAALLLALARFPPPVRVLYAGCGPFAPLCLPLLERFPAERARFTLLEAQPAAAASARRLIAATGAEPWLERLEAIDALAWQAVPAPHVIVVEAMQKGLAREPQLALMRHLAPQLAPGGVFVPEEVRLSVCLSELGREFDANGPARVVLGDVLRLNAEACRLGPPELGPLRLDVPEAAGAERSLLLLTRVRVLGALELRDYDSGISYATVLGPPDSVAAGARLEFRYDDGPEPGVRLRVLS